MVLDVAGQVVWETAAIGGWLVLSDDGGTVVTADTDGTLYAIAAPTGEVRWRADIGMWPAADLSVSADGSCVFAADRGAGAFVVVDEGAPIWSASHDVGPGRGAIAADGGDVEYHRHGSRRRVCPPGGLPDPRRGGRARVRTASEWTARRRGPGCGGRRVS
ncbi:PQQ-binding-like beta-propeller repeat protein [Natrinema sp. CBA1119]|uniref:outer membrane protein assembly factor BamB family protein n=1 Tax=Natrinema sp. CBA1119 TaxID=1608465 RepID=UPI0020D28663|nr:PQQ-binding-like beta-propeller repeat protein [Natrinema sp. CBA1119]